MHVSYESYHQFSAPLEGRVATMYCDCKGLITTGVGNLINTIASAMALPWLLSDGTKASTAAIHADWDKLHNSAMDYAKWKWSVYAKTMLCHLSDEGIDELVRHTLALNEATLKKRFPAWDSFPADAQLAIMSVSWAVGAGFYVKFQNLAKCIDEQDWEGCVASCKIREEGNPGVVPRNAKNRFCFHNASVVKAQGLPVETLCWPDVAGVSPVSSAATPAVMAARDAEIAQAAWHALEISPYDPPGAGDALLEYEKASDTDPSPPPSEA